MLLPMRLIVGTSGYSYKEWKGTFYPEDLPEAKMLGKWATEVPDGFTFVLKAPQRITHQKRLVGAGEELRLLFEAAEALGNKLGPVLFQLPPFARKDALKLREFVQILPRDKRVAFEFRHDSWFDDEIDSILRDRDAALCASDTDEVPDPDSLVHSTATWGYLRLRRTEYPGNSIADWRQR